MSAPSQTHVMQLVKIQPGERLATTPELNLAPSLVMGCREAKGMGYWAATQVKGLSREITIVVEAEPFHSVEGSINPTVKGEEGLTPPRSEPVARYQRDDMGTRETQGVPPSLGVCNTKPMDGKVLQMTLWESDQPIVPRKQGNACGGKGLTGEPLEHGHIFHTKRWIKDVNKSVSVTYHDDGGVLLKSRMRENLKSGSVRGLTVASERGWL